MATVAGEVTVGASYSSELRAAIGCFKRHGEPRLLHPLALIAQGAIAAMVNGSVHGQDLRANGSGYARNDRVIVCLPSGRRTKQSSGRDVVSAIVAEVPDVHQGLIAIRSRVLLPRPFQKDQKLLARGQRIRSRSYRATAQAAELVGREVVLFDDVVTTGASLLAARRALESAGVDVVELGALAGRSLGGVR